MPWYGWFLCGFAACAAMPIGVTGAFLALSYFIDALDWFNK